MVASGFTCSTVKDFRLVNAVELTRVLVTNGLDWTQDPNHPIATKAAGECIEAALQRPMPPREMGSEALVEDHTDKG